MLKNKIIGLIFLTVVLAALIIPVVPVYAIDQPTSPPTLSNIHVNFNLAQTGDALVYFVYNLPYSSTPTTLASDTFSFKLLDGTTELGYKSPFAYKTNGYNMGISALYFESGITDEYAYTLRISETPGQFTTPVQTDITLQASNYTNQTTQYANQTEVGTNLYAMGLLLEPSYGGKLFSSDSKLSDMGEDYFRGAIPGLQGLAPQLFVMQNIPSSNSVSDEVYTTVAFDSYAGRFDDTWVGTGQEATADQFGMGGSMAMAIIAVVPICLVFIIGVGYEV